MAIHTNFIAGDACGPEALHLRIPHPPLYQSHIVPSLSLSLSGNLYDSLYMKKNQSNDYFNHDGSTKGGVDSSNPERGHKMSRSRNMSMDLGALKKIN